MLAFLLLGLVGCHSTQTAEQKLSREQLAIASGLNPPKLMEDLSAEIVPPVGWKQDPVKSSDSHAHRVWISPTGHTAYGILYAQLPWPIGLDLTLWGVIRRMQATEGYAKLISNEYDEKLDGERFIAEVGIYRIHANLLVNGFHCWIVYAGSLRAKPEDLPELKIAADAREQDEDCSSLNSKPPIDAGSSEYPQNRRSLSFS